MAKISRLTFPAVSFDKMTSTDKETRCRLIFRDRCGNELYLEMDSMLGAATVASVQALFIAMETRLATGTAGASPERRGEWVQLASRRPKTVHADASSTIATECQVILALDEGTRHEVNYRLTPEEAEVLAQELLKAAQESRESARKPRH